jgi:hypothetical protein
MHSRRRWNRGQDNMGETTEYEFKVEFIATVRVRAQSEKHACEVVCSVLISPSAQEIVMTNQANFILGNDACGVAVDISADASNARLMPGQDNASNVNAADRRRRKTSFGLVPDAATALRARPLGRGHGSQSSRRKSGIG